MIDFDDAAYLGAETFGGAMAMPSVQTDPDGVDQSMLQPEAGGSRGWLV